MAIIVKSAIKINKGFDTWSAMVKSQDKRLGEMGIKFLFAGTEKDDPTQLHAIMMFPSMEVLQAFGACLLYTSPSPRDVEESRIPS